MALSDDQLEEIKAVAAFVRKDFPRGVMASVLEEYGIKKPEKVEESEPELDKDGNPIPPPPPVKDPKENPPVAEKKGLWWRSDEPAEDKS